MDKRVTMTVRDICEQARKGREQVYAWARRKHDPLPVYYIDGERYGQVLVSDYEAWVRRNGRLLDGRTVEDAASGKNCAAQG